MFRATDVASPPVLERYFRIAERGSTVAREVRGGLVTFVTMAYIVVLNPLIIGSFVAEGTSARTDVVGVNYPFAIATGLGIVTFVAVTIAPQVTWSERGAERRPRPVRRRAGRGGGRRGIVVVEHGLHRVGVGDRGWGAHRVGERGHGAAVPRRDVPHAALLGDPIEAAAPALVVVGALMVAQVPAPWSMLAISR